MVVGIPHGALDPLLVGGGALFGSGASSQLTGIDLPTEADADWTQRMPMAALVVQ